MSEPIIYPGVHLEEDVQLGEYVIVGVPPRGKSAGELETIISAGAVIRSHSVIYAGNHIGRRFQTGHHVTIRESNRIGNDVSIGTGSILEHHIDIEDGVRIHSGAFIPEYSRLGEGCWIGPCVTLTNAIHPLCPKAKECLKGPTIGAHAKIGANSTLLPDIRIGENALVGAGAVVVEDVPPHTVVAGNPARVMKHTDELRCRYGLLEKPYPPAERT